MEKEIVHVKFGLKDDNSSGRDTYLQFDVEYPMTLYELHDLCKRFALVLGYSANAIEETFGETVYDE